jgi:iron complex outermembrane recepter protein
MRQSKFVLTPIAVSIAVMFSSASLAQQAEKQVDEVVISGSRSASKLSETPVSIGVVRKDQWEQDKAKSVGEIINRISGVNWNDLGNEQHSMSIRQPISTNNVYQYLEDGIPIRPLGVFNHNSLNEMNMNGAGSVEVVKGAASSLYGSNAVGGAVNFLTERSSKVPYATAGFRRDNREGFSRVDTGASDSYGDLGLRFSHYSSKRDQNNWQQYSGGYKDSFTLRSDYVIDSTSWLRASFVQTDLVSDMTGSLFESDYKTNPGKSINTFTYRKDKTTRANLAWEGETTLNGLTTVTFFTRNNDHGQLPAYTISTTNGVTKGTINNNHVNSVGVDVKHEQNFSWLSSKLISGVYIDRSQNKYVSDNLSVTRNSSTGVYTGYALNSVAAPSGVRNYQADISNNAAFAQYEFVPVEKLRLVIGGRTDSITYDFVNNLTPGTNYGSPNEQRSFSKFSPKVGATYALGGTASVYSNISDGFVPPEVSQLYGKTAIPELTPASYRNFEIGFRNTLGQSAIKLDTALFRLDGKDTIVSYTPTTGDSYNRNAGKTRSQGLEVGLSQATTKFDWRIGSTWTSHQYVEYVADARPASYLDYSGKTMSAAPRHILNAQIGYRVVPKARIALGVSSVGAYWMNDANTVKYDGHDVFNLQGSYDFGNGWDGWLQVRNLFDKSFAYTASSAYKGTGAYTPNTQNTYGPGAPRSLMVGVTWAMGRK